MIAEINVVIYIKIVKHTGKTGVKFRKLHTFRKFTKRNKVRQNEIGAKDQ